MPSSRPVNQKFVIVNVTFPAGRPPRYKYIGLADGGDAQDVSLGPGDQIGWSVRVQGGSGWTQPAYTLTFQNPSILGQSTISVPNGGSSGLFSVQALSGQTKYTLAVSGVLPVSDPQIQVNPNGSEMMLARGTQYDIRWTAESNGMEVSAGGNPYKRFPPEGLPIVLGDLVQFFAVLTPPADFQIEFPPDLNSGNVWESPFAIDESTFAAINQGANENTENLLVADGSDASGARFQFMAVLTDGSAKSDAFSLILSSDQPGQHGRHR